MLCFRRPGFARHGLVALAAGVRPAARSRLPAPSPELRLMEVTLPPRRVEKEPEEERVVPHFDAICRYSYLAGSLILPDGTQLPAGYDYDHFLNWERTYP